MGSTLRRLFRRKPIGEVLGGAGDAVDAGGMGLARKLGTWDLATLGLGAIIGAGIFSSIGDLAAGAPGRPGAGPALVVSFALTAVACGFAALAYAELAAMVPVAGSAYTYAYVALGELPAWIIGWDLIIEYAVGNIYVAQSWADYARAFLRGAFGIDLPGWLATDLQTLNADPVLAASAPHLGPWAVGFNLPAAAIVALLTLLLVRGIHESARVNAVFVVLKVILIAAFVVIGARYVQPANWSPFAPNGWHGIWSGASLAFFSYIGFDAISTTAEEARDPQRTLPRGMIAALVISTALYILTALVLTGLVPAAKLASGDPLAHALEVVGLRSFSTLMSFGALIAVTAVLLVFQLGQPRILMAMARDGLLPKVFARVHRRYRTPVVGTIATGVFVGVAPTILTPAQALELTSIGTLFAFVLVSLGVVVLRIREPQRHRPFRCPGYPITPLASMGCCLILMFGLPAMNWWRFFLWLLIGVVLYAAFGARRSRFRAP